MIPAIAFFIILIALTLYIGVIRWHIALKNAIAKQNAFQIAHPVPYNSFQRRQAISQRMMLELHLVGDRMAAYRAFRMAKDK